MHVFVGASGLLFAAALASTGCSKKKDAAAEPLATSRETSAPSASAALDAAPAQPKSPKSALELELVQTFKALPAVHQLETGLVLCDDCSIGKDDRAEARLVYAFDSQGFRQLPWKLTDRQFANFLGSKVSLALKDTGGGNYRFRGEDAASPILEIYGAYDPDDIARNGGLIISHRFKRVANGWEVVEDYGQEARPPIENQAPPNQLPRAYDEALLHAPHLGEIASGPARLAGGGGPLLLVDLRRLDYFDGKVWAQREVPFQDTHVARRLSDGRTLVRAREGLFVLDREANPGKVLLPNGQEAVSAQWYLAGQRPVFVVGNSVYAAVDKTLDVLPPPEREPSQQRPEPPEPKTGIAKLSNFTPSCATPFVVLFNPPGRDYTYHLVASKLANHGELQDKLTFVEFRRDDVSYFGAQAEDESAARALMEAYKTSEPRAKPILGCLDAKSYVGDRYAVRWDAKIVLINLSAGRWL
jgi:hypothetical protein